MAVSVANFLFYYVFFFSKEIGKFLQRYTKGNDNKIEHFTLNLNIIYCVFQRIIVKIILLLLAVAVQKRKSTTMVPLS
jgi:hypothetical protein